MGRRLQGEGTACRKLWRYKKIWQVQAVISLAVGGTLAFDKAGEVNWESQLEGYCMLKIMNLVSDVKETF